MQSARRADYQSSASLLDLQRMVSLFGDLRDERPEVMTAQALVKEEWQVHLGMRAQSHSDSGGLGTSGLAKGVMALGVGAAAATGLALRHRRNSRQHEPSMSRRRFIGGTGALAAGLASRSTGMPTFRREPPDPSLTGMNVLAIIIDDLNDYPTFMGGAPMNVHTPNLDALARESRTFLNHHVTVPVCPGSRATLMWGLDVASHRSTYMNDVAQQYVDFSAQNRASTMQQVVRRAGVNAIGAGKLFHLNQFPSDWDEFRETQPPTSNPTISFDFGTPLDDRDPDRAVAAFIEQQLASIDASRPFLMMGGIRHPHLPWRVAQQYFDHYPIDDIVVPETPEDDWDDLGPVARAQLEQLNPLLAQGQYEIVVDLHGRAQIMQAYLAAMSHADAIVGQIIEAIDSQPFADETVVIVLSDNGYHQGENFAYRKRTLRDQSTRTPMMIRGPKGAGFTPEMIDQVVSSVHFMPTVLDILGVPEETPLSGESLRGDWLPASLLTTHIENSASLVYGGEGGRGGRFTVHFEESDQFDANSVDLQAASELELYDRSSDPEEFDNLLAGVAE